MNFILGRFTFCSLRRWPVFFNPNLKIMTSLKSTGPSLNRFIRCMLFVFAFFFGLVGSALAKPWSRLYVFGDSYSDSGAGYIDCNGPTAVVYLASELNLPFTAANDPNGNLKGLNFAVSGGTTGESKGKKIKDSLLGFGMKNQVADFVSRCKSGAIRFDPNLTLFFLAGGLNDRKIPTETTITNLTDEMRSLYDVGARHFYVALLPTKIRAFADVGTRLNPAITLIPDTFHLEGATICLSHWGEFFDQVMMDPSRYGITNTKDACAGRALFNQDPTPKGNPDTYYFYHDGHPSTAVHKAVGKAMAAEILAK